MCRKKGMQADMTSFVPDELARILARTPELQRSFLVGGCVRDWLLGTQVKDFDVEVFGVTYEQLASALERWGKADLVGRSFGVVKLMTPSGLCYDFSIPRLDSKVAAGHKGFSVAFDPGITPQQAAARRDYTINAMAFDPRQNRLLDFFDGEDDLHRHILRHTSDAFVEDPLRVLRGMQFASRFGLMAAPETVALCHQIKDSYRELAIERVWEEWAKWAEKSRLPSAGLKFLLAAGWIEHFPEIKVLAETPQDPEWHPEGDVFIHTCHCLDALVQLPEWQAADPMTRIVLSMAVLAHDFAKPQTTQKVLKGDRERIISPGHEEAGGALALAFLQRLKAPGEVQERVAPLVSHHLAHLHPITDRSIRRLARRLQPETIPHLCLVMTADQFGRPPLPQIVPQSMLDLRAKAEILQVQAGAPKPILMGRHLMALGMTPGVEMGAILKAAYEAQLDGEFGSVQQSLLWLTRQRVLPLPPELVKALHIQKL
jgi:tRNA nucleotidyltransferase (CCA-adding enzyme)